MLIKKKYYLMNLFFLHYILFVNQILELMIFLSFIKITI